MSLNMFLKSKLNLSPDKQYLITAFFSGLMIVVLFYFFDLSCLLKQIKEEKQSAIALHKEIAIIKIALQKDYLLEKQTLELEKKFNAVMKHYALTSDFSDFLRMFARSTKTSSVDMISITPQKEIVIKNYIIVPIEIIAAGNYSELASLLFYLCNSQYVLSIKQMELKAAFNDYNSGGDKKIIMKITFNLYRLNNLMQAVLGNGKEKITANFTLKKMKAIVHDPFNFSITENSTRALLLWQVQELQMLGSIKEDKKIWAVIAAPDGSIFRVTVGDLIGQNKSKIVSIDSSGIFTNNQNDFLYAN